MIENKDLAALIDTAKEQGRYIRLNQREAFILEQLAGENPPSLKVLGQWIKPPVVDGQMVAGIRKRAIYKLTLAVPLADLYGLLPDRALNPLFHRQAWDEDLTKLSLEEISRLTDKQLLERPNFGPRSLELFRKALAARLKS